ARHPGVDAMLAQSWRPWRGMLAQDSINVVLQVGCNGFLALRKIMAAPQSSLDETARPQHKQGRAFLVIPCYPDNAFGQQAFDKLLDTPCGFPQPRRGECPCKRRRRLVIVEPFQG